MLVVLWAVVNLFGTGSALAQGDIPEDLVITIGQFDVSNYPEITLYVNVTDRSGRNVTTLKQEHFSVTEDGSPVEVVGFAGMGQPRLVDIVYVFDTTGSMSNEIDGVIRTSQAFADELVSKGRDYRLGLVAFGDDVRQVYRPDDTLTDNANEFKGWVGSLKAQGGDGQPENDYGAIKRAAQMKFRQEAQKIFILITDAPPHRYGDERDSGVAFDDPDLDHQPILNLVQGKGISIYAVTPSYNEFTSLAEATGGRFYDIKRNPDFTSIIEAIGETIASQYRITYRSPRPNYDGTRRNVQVKVGSAATTTAYHEQHLLTIQSNWLVGVLCLFPLLAALAMPLGAQALVGYLRAQQADVKAGMAQVPEVSTCQRCGHALKPGARFCPACGQPMGVAQAGPGAPAQVHASRCPNCDQDLRAGARFCNRCGFRLPS